MTSILPDAAGLAQLVSKVTQTMCGTTFVPGDQLARGESLCRQMVMIPLRGEPPILVVVACDQKGSRALCSAFFGCSAEDISQSMADDAIGELLNMVAGQLAMTMPRHSLGLPRQTTLAEIARESGVGFEDAVLLRSEGTVDLGLWILETRTAATGTERQNTGSVLRSLLSKIVPSRVR